eukprot:TRINITY_DN2331_c0_g1_i1.p1 TRINITY_DN2331_c0_g1~~TRINITY_DN2331_c0_g1_i1.p1  ORF type:complete len:750 (+),score=81.08 TRINITY_DN2331_c0_g1_i1:399-2648(+)
MTSGGLITEGASYSSLVAGITPSPSPASLDAPTATSTSAATATATAERAPSTAAGPDLSARQREGVGAAGSSSSSSASPGGRTGFISPPPHSAATPRQSPRLEGTQSARRKLSFDFVTLASPSAAAPVGTSPAPDSSAPSPSSLLSPMTLATTSPVTTPSKSVGSWSGSGVGTGLGLVATSAASSPASSASPSSSVLVRSVVSPSRTANNRMSLDNLPRRAADTAAATASAAPNAAATANATNDPARARTGVNAAQNGAFITPSQQLADNQILYRGVLAQELLHLSPFSSNSSATPSSAAAVTSAAASPVAGIQRSQASLPPSPGRIYSFSSIGTTDLQRRSEPSPFSLSPITAGSEKILSKPRKPQRKIPAHPYKVLEAPSIQDDFYLNVVDWSPHNVLAVGLGQSLYLWNASTSSVTKLCQIDRSGELISSVSWIDPRSGNSNIAISSPSSAAMNPHLIVGTSRGRMMMYDTSTLQLVREWTGHSARVGTIAFCADRQWLATGSRDKSIIIRDLRVASSRSNASETDSSILFKLTQHRQEVCGLKWSPQFMQPEQLASGGNDNKVLVWDARSLESGPLYRYTQHTAAIKAIAWSPHQRGLLTTGGGTADRCIRFWNTLGNSSSPGSGSAANVGADVNSQIPLLTVDTGSQVCNLAWSRNLPELVSTHGFSQNQVIVWSYPSMRQLASLTGHTMRVLYLALSPDGQTIVTGAGDETLRFWSIWPPSKTSLSDPSMLFSGNWHSRNDIR